MLKYIIWCDVTSAYSHKHIQASKYQELFNYVSNVRGKNRDLKGSENGR